MAGRPLGKGRRLVRFQYAALMVDRLGKYSDGTPILKNDFVRTYRDTIVNVLEACEGAIVCGTLDEWGNHGWMDIGSFEDYCLDLVRRWDDPALFVGQWI